MLASSRHISKNFVASAYRVSRYFSNVQTSVPVEPKKRPTEFQDEFVKRLVDEELITIPNFINEDEERSLLDELDPILTRARYQNAHWDDAITEFRETERKSWRATNRPIIDRLRQKTLDALKEEPRPEGVPQASSFDDLLPHIHVLDLASNGWIKPHVDSIRYCGSVVAVLSLLADSVARFTVADPVEVAALTDLLPASRPGNQLPPPGASTDIHVQRRMLYIMRGITRYRLTHAILPSGIKAPNEDGSPIIRGRRVTVICRPKADSFHVGNPNTGGESSSSYSYGDLS